MTNRYDELTQAFRKFLSKEWAPDALKPVAARDGIYQQKNGAFMTRIRVSGGEISCARLNGIADILDAVGALAHLTTRQDIQLHDVPARRVIKTVKACDALGLPFKGGGGNTYRNLAVDAFSGLSRASVFDVYPYAKAVHHALMAHDPAFDLPRKIKIGFFSGDDRVFRASVQDLGFAAELQDRQRGFRLYIGGGLGRESRTGILLIPFLPAADILRAVLAAVTLFHIHGDRVNRNQARLRFVLQRLGEDAFTKLFWDTYDATPAVPFTLMPADGTRLPPRFPRTVRAVKPLAGFEHWRGIAVTATRFPRVRSVRLFVPYGNLTSGQLRAITAIATEAGSPFLRVLPTQDLLIPFVAEAALPALHRRLIRELPDLDLTFRSYRGHLVTCVGATVCKIGVADTPAAADALADALDHHLPPDTPKKRRLLKDLADGVRISGCPNACSGHPVARYGILCVKQRVGDSVHVCGRLYAGAGIDGNGKPRLSTPTQDAPLTLDQIARQLAEE